MMIKEFENVASEIMSLIDKWMPLLADLDEDLITLPRNKQNRNIKEIVGHMVDSASNNTHRVVHLQYRESPLIFPNYATNGNNDRWIAIQNYKDENWMNLVNLWKHINLHFVHVISNTDASKLNRQWYYNEDSLITLKEMVIDYVRHLRLHLNEIEGLIGQSSEL